MDKPWSSPKKQVAARRRLRGGRKTPPLQSGIHSGDTPLGSSIKMGDVKLAESDLPPDDGRKHKKRVKMRVVEVTTSKALTLKGAGFYDPMQEIRKAINNSLDPTQANGKVKTLADMTKDERVQLMRESKARIEQVERGMDPALLAPVTIEKVRCRKSTKKALLLSCCGHSKWFARTGLLTGTTLKTPGCTGTIVIPRWVALKVGFLRGVSSVEREGRSDMRQALIGLALEWRRRMYEAKHIKIGEFNRGVRTAMRACGLELLKIIRQHGGASSIEDAVLKEKLGSVPVE